MNAPHIDRATLRLAASYFGVIMTLCVMFSAAFYFVSVAGLDVTVSANPTGDTSITSGRAAEPSQRPPGEIPPNEDQLRPDAKAIAAHLQQQVAMIRSGLFYQLVLFNCGAALAGMIASYLLARWTLRPINRAVEMQMRFASNASHELRTPLTIMQTELDIVLATPRLTLERAREALRSNYEEVQRLRSLTDSLLLLARDEVLPRSRHRLAPSIEAACNAVQPLAAAHHIVITRHVSSSVHAQLHQASFTQAITILLDNAIRYSPEGSTVEVSTTHDNAHVHLHVKDHGIGIAQDEIDRIRQRFYRSERGQTLQTHGHGLGLSIADTIIAQHHAVLTIASALGVGSTFTITLKKA